MNNNEKFAKKLLEFNLGGPICRNYPECTNAATAIAPSIVESICYNCFCKLWKIMNNGLGGG
jgi:hypothetical protein